VIVWSGSVFDPAVQMDNPWTVYPSGAPGCQGDHRYMRAAGPGAGGLGMFDSFVKPLLLDPVVAARSNPARAAQMTGTQSLPQVTGVQTAPLRPAGRLAFTQPAEPAELMTFAVLGDPDRMAVSLCDPSGQVFTPATSLAQARYFTMTDFLVGAGYTISNPATGVWTVTVDANAQTPAAGMTVMAFGSLNSDIQLDSAYQLVEPALTDGPRAITASLHAQLAPVAGAVVTATVTGPRGDVSTLVLRDDGQHADGAPDDGMYGAFYTTREAGFYSVVVRAAGSHGGIGFSRTAVLAVQVMGGRYIPLVQGR